MKSTRIVGMLTIAAMSFGSLSAFAQGHDENRDHDRGDQRYERGAMGNRGHDEDRHERGDARHDHDRRDEGRYGHDRRDEARYDHERHGHRRQKKKNTHAGKKGPGGGCREAKRRRGGKGGKEGKTRR